MATPPDLNLQIGKNNTVSHIPKWEGPKHVKLQVSTKMGGVSRGQYSTWNLANHVLDDAIAVQRNRELLQEQVGKLPLWLNQVHSSEVVAFTKSPFGINIPSADGMVSTLNNYFLNILTADCLPILMTDTKGEVVAACHAGWRGLANGIITNTLQAMSDVIQPDSPLTFQEGIHVYIGPAISQKNYEVGSEMKDLFTHQLQLDTEHANALFLPSSWSEKKCYADLFGLAIHALNRNNVHQIYTERYCTFDTSEYFYSYRREAITGRFASSIWFE